MAVLQRILPAADKTAKLISDPWLVSRVAFDCHQWQIVVDQTCDGAVEQLCHFIARLKVVQPLQRRPVSVHINRLAQHHSAVITIIIITIVFSVA